MSPITLNTAKLSNICGSPELRTKAAAKFRADFSKMLNDTFEKKSLTDSDCAITLDEVREFYKKLIPNVSINIKKADEGYLQSYLDVTGQKVEGYNLGLKCISGRYIHKWDASRISTLEHENAHLSMLITNPKVIARESLTNLNKGVREGQEFYYDVLYADELKKMTPDVAKQLKSDISRRKEVLKDNILRLFESVGYSPKEKMELLQAWRYSLRDELLAYRVGADAWANNKYPFKVLADKLKNNEQFDLVEKDLNTDRLIAKYSSEQYNTMNEKLFGLRKFINIIAKDKYYNDVEKCDILPEKLDLIEKILVDEITSARKVLKDKLVNKN